MATGPIFNNAEIQRAVSEELEKQKIPDDVNVVHLALVGSDEKVELRVATRVETQKALWEVGGVVGYLPKSKDWEVGINALVTWPRR